jgi:hypothetical protein
MKRGLRKKENWKDTGERTKDQEEIEVKRA